MRVIIPENIKDITLAQFQRYEELISREGLTDLEHNRRTISIFSNLKYRQVSKQVSQSDYERLLGLIIKALGQDAPFEKFFEMDGVRYGFEPNLDKIPHALYVDAIKCMEAKDLHKLMSMLFRPVKKEDSFGNYKIKAYGGTNPEMERQFKQMPMNIVKGAQGFFLTLLHELEIYTLRYTSQEIVKAHKRRTTFKNGVGMLRLFRYRRAKFGN